MGDFSKDANPWGLPEWETKKSKTGQDVPREFLQKCGQESQKEVYDDKDLVYISVSSWCTKAIVSSTVV